MAVEIKVPDMGESVIEATVAHWIKKEGDRVASGEPVVELETDKVNLEVSAQHAGILEKIAHAEGDTVAVGDVLAIIGEDGGAVQPEKPSTAPASAPASQPAAAAPATPLAAPGTPQAVTATPVAASATPLAVTATPVAVRMAQELGVDLAKVQPTGSGGRITKEDVQAFHDRAAETPAPVAPSATSVAPTPVAPSVAPATPVAPVTPVTPSATSVAPATSVGQTPVAPTPVPPPATSVAPSAPPQLETRERMTRRRQTIARRLVEAQHTAAMLTTFNEIDMSAVVSLRKKRREGFKERFGVDLGFMSFFVKATVAALKAFPHVNAEIASGPQGDEIVIKHYYDIGVAIGAEEGLVVPVIRGADRLNFAGIEQAIKDFVGRVKNNSLTLDDLRGGTFTITNGGVYGSLMSTPILNPPQVGILGMHAIKDRAVVVNGEIVVRPMMYVALSYDHRIVDGREAVQFLVRIKELVEDPDALLFG